MTGSRFYLAISLVVDVAKGSGVKIRPAADKATMGRRAEHSGRLTAAEGLTRAIPGCCSRLLFQAQIPRGQTAVAPPGDRRLLESGGSHLIDPLSPRKINDHQSIRNEGQIMS